jgi:hypothetical protein
MDCRVGLCPPRNDEMEDFHSVRGFCPDARLRGMTMKKEWGEGV